MIILSVFAFLAGVVTILSPCILPVLPIILSVSVGDQGKRRPLGVIAGFILSFTLFTLFLSSIVRWTGVPADALRFASVIIIAGFGLILLVPKVQGVFELWSSKLSRFSPNPAKNKGFMGGVLIGFSLGLLWTPCVGPILASVISLAIIGEVTWSAFVITFAYSLGTAVPMFFIMVGGGKFLPRSKRIQQIFGLVMIMTALAISTNLDRKFQTFVLNKFPQYGSGLTKLEDNNLVKTQLEDMGNSAVDAPELILGGEWFNSDPLKLSDLRGKVVLIDFWTYTCINCQRTLPYLKSWWEKYEDSGLVIIGVHSPEFEFEKNPENVRKAIEDFGLRYPVMQDNNFSTWKAYKNRYWPAKYLIDKDGKIRYTHFGEGAYDETESVIQALLKEAGTEISDPISNPEYDIHSRTPETYLGYSRMAGFVSPERPRVNTYATYTAPNNIPGNKFAFVGEWFVGGEYSSPKSGASLRLNFEAKEVFLVMRPKFSDESKVNISLDGHLRETVTVSSDSLYKIVELDSPGSHLLELEFLDDNVEIFAFTFG